MPSPATRAGTSPLPNLGRPVSIIPPSSATGFYHGVSNLGNSGQSCAAPGLNFSVGEDECTESIEGCDKCHIRAFAKEGNGEWGES